MKTWNETTSLRNYNQAERPHRIREIAECLSTYMEGSGNVVWPLDVKFTKAQHIVPNSFQVNNIVTARDDRAVLGCNLKMIIFGEKVIPSIYTKGVIYRHIDNQPKFMMSKTTLPLEPKIKNWVEESTGLPFIVGAQLFSSNADSIFAPPVVAEYDAIAASYAMAIHELLPPNELRLPRCNEVMLIRQAHDIVVNRRKILEEKVLHNVFTVYKKFFESKPKDNVIFWVREYCKNIALQVAIPEKAKVYEKKLAVLRSTCG